MRLASEVAEKAARKAVADGTAPMPLPLDPELKKEEEERKQKERESAPRKPDRGLVAAVRYSHTATQCSRDTIDLITGSPLVYQCG